MLRLARGPKQPLRRGRGRSKREKEKVKDGGSSTAIWQPSFITPDKQQILYTDSLRLDKSLGKTLAVGYALQSDIKRPDTLKSAMDDFYYYSGRVSSRTIIISIFISFHLLTLLVGSVGIPSNFPNMQHASHSVGYVNTTLSERLR